ncbi:MAG TPA: hypothetical protein VNZ86_15145 [Bacteroidia bacterium]|jgi:hypothetical protein|nr:hypothetical protein [Bacteroidia bacterium]
MEIITALVFSKEFAVTALFFTLDGVREILIFAGYHHKVAAWYRNNRINRAKQVLAKYHKGGK